MPITRPGCCYQSCHCEQPDTPLVEDGRLWTAMAWIIGKRSRATGIRSDRRWLPTESLWTRQARVRLDV